MIDWFPLSNSPWGGASSVRGYPQNTFVRDAGYGGSIEVRYPLVDSTAKRIQFNPVLFFDFGEAWNKGQQHEQLRSVGLGVTMQIRRLYGEVFYGSKLIDVQGSDGGNIQNKGFHAQVLYAF
jgi:hemolysin activation/secretion protein